MNIAIVSGITTDVYHMTSELDENLSFREAYKQTLEKGHQVELRWNTNTTGCQAVIDLLRGTWWLRREP